MDMGGSGRITPHALTCDRVARYNLCARGRAEGSSAPLSPNFGPATTRGFRAPEGDAAATMVRADNRDAGRFAFRCRYRTSASFRSSEWPRHASRQK